MDDTGNGSKGQPGLAEAALFGLCPQCGAKTLFAGYAKFAPRCRACGLDNAQFNVGDGPAAFLTMVIGAVVVGLALWTEFRFHPPVWVHALLWIPMVFGSTLWGLRVTKAALLTAEFQRKAREATDKDVRGE
ncbi:MAG TPA: DUF983 domain-containing protein [Novosphingobium sp.]|jgi:uncharacterized protein (DUF983 family)|nr:DUF983 domain-containing protein [Novosphingobium sp.]HQN55259.1 DUF983 domain-containing protein [Novosphingobium sp.]